MIDTVEVIDETIVLDSDDKQEPMYTLDWHNRKFKIPKKVLAWLFLAVREGNDDKILSKTVSLVYRQIFKGERFKQVLEMRKNIEDSKAFHCILCKDN